MSILAIPGNDTYMDVSVFDTNAALAHVKFTEEERDLATKYLTRHAPDLLDMVVGSEAA